MDDCNPRLIARFWERSDTKDDLEIYFAEMGLVFTFIKTHHGIIRTVKPPRWDPSVMNLSSPSEKGWFSKSDMIKLANEV